MLQSEKKSLFRFVFFYIVSTFLLLVISVAIFLRHEMLLVKDEELVFLKNSAKNLHEELEKMHRTFFLEELYYPTSDEYESAIFDSAHELIFSDFSPQDVDFSKMFYRNSDGSHYIEEISPYYLGAKYILIRKKFDSVYFDNLKRNIAIFLVVSFFVISFISFVLGKLFTAPMRSSIRFLDNFIKDTTHELNTPVSIIMTNAEMFECMEVPQNIKKYVKRIEVASKTLSNIYEDLIFLQFNHRQNIENKECNISEITQERLEYFKILAESKKITIKSNIKPNIALFVDSNLFMRMVDNLLSNAVKYNRLGGEITLTLDEKHLSLKDTGIGIEKDKKEIIFKRFERLNDSEGGFGIGLNIVNRIVQIYNFKIFVESEVGKGTEVVIKW